MQGAAGGRGSAGGAAERVAVSIVCVSNAPEVLESTLRRSVEQGRADAPDTELIVVDNRAGMFKTAGAALNHGARQATKPVIAFIHQDVYLHSVPALETAAGVLRDSPDIGVMGAVGVDRRGRVIGRIRDRVVPSGEPASVPRDVDSFDEVLILVERDRILRDPLADDPALGWHAYAVEYSLRMRRQGLRAVVMDIPLTHNSLTANLAGLAVAHRWVGARYPEAVPARTTCGIVYRSAAQAALDTPARRARGALRWWRESVSAQEAGRLGADGVVIADIRDLVDRAAEAAGRSRIRVLEADHGDDAGASVSGLSRYGRPFAAVRMPIQEIDRELAGADPDELLLVVNLRPADLGALVALATMPHVIGLSEDTGLWVVPGIAPSVLAPLWSRRRNRPLARMGTQ